jgi:hypothetical protein
VDACPGKRLEIWLLYFEGDWKEVWRLRSHFLEFFSFIHGRRMLFLKKGRQIVRNHFCAVGLNIKEKVLELCY